MTDNQYTLSKFIAELGVWAEKTNNDEAKLFIKEWKELSTEEEWQKIGPLPLKPNMVMDFTRSAAAHLWLRIGTICNPSYEQRLEESRAFLRAIHEKAVELGMQVDIKKIELPLTPPVPVEWLCREKVGEKRKEESLGENPGLLSAIRIIGSLTRENLDLGARAFKIWKENRFNPENPGKGFDPSECVDLAIKELYGESPKGG